MRSPVTHEEIVTTLRGFVGSRRTAPIVDAAVAAAERVLALRELMRLWRPPIGVRLVATDAAWSSGAGAVVEAPIQTHLLTLTGRRLDSVPTY